MLDRRSAILMRQPIHARPCRIRFNGTNHIHRRVAHLESAEVYAIESVTVGITELKGTSQQARLP